MKKTKCYFFFFASLLLNFAFLTTDAQSVGIGTNTPNSAAQLDVNAVNKGLLPPRMTYAQRNSIANPPAGLMIFCTNCGINGEMQYFNGVEWISMGAGTASGIPSLLVYAINQFDSTSMDVQSYITSEGGSPILSKGVCWSTNPNPTTALSTKIFDTTADNFYYSHITGLVPRVAYHVRSFATNQSGTAYSRDTTITLLSGSTLHVGKWYYDKIYDSAFCCISRIRSGLTPIYYPDSSRYIFESGGAYDSYLSLLSNNTFTEKYFSSAIDNGNYVRGGDSLRLNYSSITYTQRNKVTLENYTNLNFYFPRNSYLIRTNSWYSVIINNGNVDTLIWREANEMRKN